MKEETKKIIIDLSIVSGIAIIFIFLISQFSIGGYFNQQPFSSSDEVWEFIKSSEEAHYFNGKLIAVDYIDCGYNCDYTLIVLDHHSFHFKSWDYAELKNYEGQEVEILCYSTHWDGYYSLSCANWREFDNGYIKTL